MLNQGILKKSNSTSAVKKSFAVRQSLTGLILIGEGLATTPPTVDKAALQSAITSAEGVFNDTDATQEQADEQR